MNPFFGDVVIYKGNCLESKILKPFIGEFTHSALRLNRGTAQSLDIWGIMKHDLNKPDDCYNEYIILRHKEIVQRTQKDLSRLNRKTNSNYDLQLIFQIALKKILGNQPDRKNMYHPGKSHCSSRIAHMYEIVGLEINPYIHFSQIEPKHFLDSLKFKVIEEWKKTECASRNSKKL